MTHWFSDQPMPHACVYQYACLIQEDSYASMHNPTWPDMLAHHIGLSNHCKKHNVHPVSLNASRAATNDNNKCNPLQSHTSLQFLLLAFQLFQALFNFLFKVLFTFPSWYLYTISLKHIFSFTWNLPPALHSNSKEHDSWEHTLHESLHMTHKSFTFVATFSQMACTHTFISNTTLKYNSRHKVQIVNVSSSWFIRHY